MNITMARGDLETRTFQVLISEEEGSPEVYTGAFDEIYFTVKKTIFDKNYLFQKRLGNGTISSIGDGCYQFRIEPEDTDPLPYGDYVFDIELVKDGDIKKTFRGSLVLTDEVTFAENEVTV